MGGPGERKSGAHKEGLNDLASLARERVLGDNGEPDLHRRRPCPVDLGRAYEVVTYLSPLRPGAMNLTASTETVTQLLPEWRSATANAVRSIKPRTTPPNTVFSLFRSFGKILYTTATRGTRGDSGGRQGQHR